jgi:hypothetical protein
MAFDRSQSLAVDESGLINDRMPIKTAIESPNQAEREWNIVHSDRPSFAPMVFA